MTANKHRSADIRSTVAEPSNHMSYQNINFMNIKNKSEVIADPVLYERADQLRYRTVKELPTNVIFADRSLFLVACDFLDYDDIYFIFYVIF